MSDRVCSIGCVLSMVLFASGCASPSETKSDLSVVSEPAGTNCAHGGVRITDGEGTVQYVCNGAPGDDVQLDDEPPGENCANGGLRVRAADGSVSWICSGESAPPTVATLCPGATWLNAPGGPGMFAEFGGEFAIPGGAYAPAVGDQEAWPNVLRVAAVCHGFDAITQGGFPTGKFEHQPLTIVTSLDQALPLLSQAQEQNRPLVVHLRVYGVDELGAPTVDATVSLENAQLVLVEQFVGADPERPGTRRPFVRLALLYQRYTYTTFGPSGTQVLGENPSFSALPPQTPCVGVQSEREPVLALLQVNGMEVSGSSGDSTYPGAIEVYGSCLRVESEYSGALLTGVRHYGALVLVKPQDASSASLQRALLKNQNVELTLKFRQRDPGTGALDEVFEEEVQNGRVVGYEQFLLEGTRMERVHVSYPALRQTWLEGNVTVEIAPPQR